MNGLSKQSGPIHFIHGQHIWLHSLPGAAYITTDRTPFQHNTVFQKFNLNNFSTISISSLFCHHILCLLHVDKHTVVKNPVSLKKINFIKYIGYMVHSLNL